MSYVLHVWEKPVPTTAEEADAIHGEIFEKEPGQNPKFIEFARRVMEKHPCGEDEDGEDIWTELPFDGVMNDAVFSFLILSQFLEEIYPTVVQIANELGLLVYDTQSGDVFLANGKRLQFGRGQQDPVVPAANQSATSPHRSDIATVTSAELETHVVFIWEQPATLPLPGDIAAAVNLIKLLSRIKPGPNPKYAELERLLTSRYPDTFPPEGMIQNMGKLASDAIYTLAIRTGNLKAIRPLVIETASGLGLHVYDEKAEEAFFADGTKVSKGDRRTTEMELMIHDRLVGFMAANGYEPIAGRRDFLKKFEGGWHSVSPYVYETWPPHYAISFTARHEHFAISKLYSEIAHPEHEWKPTYDGGPLVMLYPSEWTVEKDQEYANSNGDFILRKAAELDSAMMFIQRQIERHLFPILDQCETLSGFDALVNPPNLADSVFFVSEFFHGFDRGYRNVLAAYLAGNPRQEEICETVDAALKGQLGWSSSFENSRKCVEYVRLKRPGTNS